MAATPNLGIPLFGGAELAKLDTLLNNQAAAIDTIVAAMLARHPRTGTLAERNALAAGARTVGLIWRDSVTGLDFMWDGSAWKNTRDVQSVARTGPIATNAQLSIGTTRTNVTGLAVTFTLPTASVLRFCATVNTHSGSTSDTVLLSVTNGTLTSDIYRPANSSPTLAPSTNTHCLAWELNVPAGTHTFRVQAARALGSGAVTAASLDSAPNTLSVDRIG